MTPTTQEATVSVLNTNPSDRLFLSQVVRVSEGKVDTKAKTLTDLQNINWIVRLVDRSGKHINVQLNPASASDQISTSQDEVFLRCAGSNATVFGKWEKRLNHGDQGYILTNPHIDCLSQP